MFKLLVFASLLAFAIGREFKLINHCDFTIWPGWQGASATPNGGGTTLHPCRTHIFQAPDNWKSGRIWARTGCNSNFHCETGGCGHSEQCSGNWGATGVTLSEFTLTKWKDLDFYDVSHVDGYNVQITIKPINGSGDCKVTGACNEDLLDSCPKELRVYKHGRTVECRSACTKFRSHHYCCTGKYGTKETCGPTDYSRFFKERCPKNYSYAYDDATSRYTCKDANYEVHFC
uniref:Thaumatin-like protein n=1 Tax=Panagrellus redivivus TaxID=6233 RepID=A0A7E4VAM3_PANRE